MLFNHAPIVSTLAVGEVVISKPDNSQISYAVSGGFVEMNDNVMTLLAEKAEEASLIDVDEARALEVDAKVRLKDKNSKEIYEGDLLQMDEEAQYQADKVVEVAYYWGIPCGKLPNEDIIVQDLHELCADNIGNYKPKHGVAGVIIGNIYENPELLIA